MVDGRKIINTNECIVVDLDNTLIDVNSTRMLAEFLVCKFLSKGKFGKFLNIVGFFIFRKTGRISHIILKHKIVCTALSELSEKDLNYFADKLITKLNPKVVELILTQIKHGRKVLIATAASDIFMPLFLERLPFDSDFIATPYSQSLDKYIENRSEEKLKNVTHYLETNGLILKIFITDHFEDRPLLEYNQGHNYLVGPSKTTLECLKGIKYTII